MTKKQKKRDMQASTKTLAYFLTTRGGKPTTIKQASRALKVSPDRLHNRLMNLTNSGKLQRIDRGLYQAAAPAVQDTKPLNLDQFLEELLKEKKALDDHIERVKHVIELKRDRGLH